MRIVFRPDADNEEELAAATHEAGPRLVTNLAGVEPGDLVVGRYSVLPFYKWIYDTVVDMGAELVNTPEQHEYVAQMVGWVSDLGEMTPRTWFKSGYATVPECEHGWVVKGRTNSRKFQWNTHMFARTRSELAQVIRRAYDDPLLAAQGVVLREYVPLVELGEGINGMPITDEWRYFFLDGQLVARGFYWSILEEQWWPAPDPQMDAFAQTAADIVRDKVPFVVIDVARRATGGFIVVELNDGQMSGLSTINPRELYAELPRALSAYLYRRSQ